ncbi:MAG: RNA polymerase sigma factor [Putridiphycobacter sp.]|nr:RNA polymerase sigma factor [Putridiphycobacter sp.]
MTDEELIKKCTCGDLLAQKAFYEKFAGKMFGVCLRYMNGDDEAQDVLQDGFIKVFDNLEKYQKKGSLEGWVRRIIVNTALDQIRKNKKYLDNVDADSVSYLLEDEVYIVEELEADDLLKIINRLPVGYRVVFNLFAIEGYSHKEIAAKLDITESTSKSQYSRARKILRTVLLKNEYVEEGER